MSDGAASQYKNRKNFANICNFKNKYGVECEWHFFATSHGKGPCDGIGGTLKRMATRACLAKEYENPIKDAEEMYNWANQHTEQMQTKISFCYVSNADYKNMESDPELESLMKNAKMIPGTQKFHSFIPVSSHQIAVKIYSNNPEDPKIFNVL